jgi:hypothetical protein
MRYYDLLVNNLGIDEVKLFDRVAGRYHNLLRGKPWTTEKYKMYMDVKTKCAPCHYPVAPWERQAMDVPQNDRPFQFPQPLWTYEEGLVVFLDDARKTLLLKDLESGQSIAVPLDLNGKMIRNIRLRQRVLAVEWAESTGSLRLNEEEVAHRHFATFFDIKSRLVKRSGDPLNRLERTSELVSRNELKLHFCGLPLNKRDRFFSNHSPEYYAVYFWQPNRSMYTGDEEAPIESLAVWDISDPSEYRPSDDPSGHKKPFSGGPEHIVRLGFRELDFYDVRQRDVPSFTDLCLDDGNVYVIETTSVWLKDLETLKPIHQTTGWIWGCRAVGIPLRGFGPSCVQYCKTRHFTFKY